MLPMKAKTALNNWLEQLNQQKIDLGLERVKTVFEKLKLKPPQIITVAGTNGKGSVIATLSALLQSKGVRVGCFTSPHLFRFNERITINDEMLSDEAILFAFVQIQSAQKQVNLSYFEYAFLAACYLFEQHQADVWLMEVGLGGRLDAVNVLNADAAIITTIDFDHTHILGDSLEQIGAEKAGILRPGQVACFAAENCPASIVDKAKQINCDLQRCGIDYRVERNDNGFNYHSTKYNYQNLNRPKLRGDWQIDNAAAAINVLSRLGYRFTTEEINAALPNTKLKARLQIIQDSPQVVVDVAHNAQSASALAQWLHNNPAKGTVRAVFSVLADKNLTSWLPQLQAYIDHFFIFELDNPRRSELTDLRQQMADCVGLISCCENAHQAYQQALKCSEKDDRIVIFGSFHVIDEVFREQGDIK